MQLTWNVAQIFIKKERGSVVVPEQNKLSDFALKINNNI